MKNKLKSLAAPKTWAIERKKDVWTMKPKGPHKMEQSLAIGTVLKQYLNYCRTSKEARNVVHKKGILVNNRKAMDIRASVGIMDIVEIPELKEKYVVLVSTRGKLCFSKTNADFRISKITGKRAINGKTQLNLFGGENLFVEKGSFKVGDSVLLDLKSPAIKEHLKLEDGASCFLLGGSHVGEAGIIKQIKNNKIIIAGRDGNDFETLKKFVYVTGKDKSLVNVCEI